MFETGLIAFPSESHNPNQTQTSLLPEGRLRSTVADTELLRERLQLLARAQEGA